MTDTELRDLKVEAEGYPECVECRRILRLIAEVERLKALVPATAMRPKPTLPKPSVGLKTGR